MRGRRAVLLKAIAVLALAWGVVWGVRSFAGGQRVTSEKVAARVEAADFADWSEREAGEGVEARRREEEIQRIAEMVNRLDFQEREKNRRNRVGEEFFRRLSAREKGLFIDLTVTESMTRFMEALDAMPQDQRRRFVEEGLREVAEGRTAEEMARAEALGDEVLERITQEGLRAYFEKAGADTKLDLAPLMEAMNEVMQGLRGDEFGMPIR